MMLTLVYIVEEFSVRTFQCTDIHIIVHVSNINNPVPAMFQKSDNLFLCLTNKYLSVSMKMTKIVLNCLQTRDQQNK